MRGGSLLGFLGKRVKVIDWDDNRLGRFDFIRGYYVVAMIFAHAF